MPVKDKFNEVSSFITKCEATTSGAGLKSALQRDQGHSTGISLRYTVYRWIQFMMHNLIMVGAILELETWTLKTYAPIFYAKWLLYLTSWVLIGNMVQSLLGAILVTMAYRHVARGGERSTPGNSSVVYGVSKKLVEAYRTMYCVALNFAVFMVFGYWELMGGIPKALSPEDKTTFGWYGLSAFLMLLDLFVVRFPYKMKTGLYSLGTMVSYLGVTWVHVSTRSLDAYQKKPYIYPGLDWSKPGITAGHAVSSIFILEVINCSTLWWLCQLRRLVMNKLDLSHHQHGAETANRQNSTPIPQPPANFHDPHDHKHLEQPQPTEPTDRPMVDGSGYEPQMEKPMKKKNK